jgi:NAD(P)-dependent dehydrogenase (short-subunit alcohol dehydrogenase family)
MEDMRPQTPSTVVITGVTRGLGRAMVEEFARLGHIVLGCARTESEIRKLKGAHPTQDFQVVNVASEPHVKIWAERLVKKYGAPDFILNNAAILNSKVPLWQVDSREFSEEVDVNLKGVVNVIRHFVPSMAARRRGVIVNFISRWGTKFEPHMGPYCATKAAVVVLTRVLSEELRPLGLSAVALNPGVVRTGMLRKYLDGGRGTDMSTYPTPVEWAKAAVPYVLRLCLNDSGKLRNVSWPLQGLPMPPLTKGKDGLPRYESRIRRSKQ